MSTTRVDTEEIASTKSEKFLAVILTVFILIGAGWSYAKTDQVAGVGRTAEFTVAEQGALDKQSDAADRFVAADEANESAKADFDLARSELGLAVDRGEPTAALEKTYRAAKASYLAARAEVEAAKAASDKADESARAAQERYDRRADDKGAWSGWLSAGLRLILIGALTLGGLRLIRRVRERESRYLPLGFAVVGSGAIMAFVFAVDYVTDYVDILDFGPIALSLLGIAATLGAFVALQKYLARRIPRSRVRKGECPFCGFPVHAESGPHCEGCGREVLATCASCEAPRRVGSPFCPACGES
ncbi:zinc ribbon domain-containing protein [Aeromicrobium sp. P5_D10]